MQLMLTLEIWRKGRWYIARCPELDFVSQGESPEKARQNLYELIQIQFEEMGALGTLEDYLWECGYRRDHGAFVSPLEVIGLEKFSVPLS